MGVCDVIAWHTRRMRTKTLAASVVLALALTGCTAAPDTEPTTPASSSPPDRTEVNWGALPPDYQRIVDEETAEQDCDALQDMFDAAPTDIDLLAYLDEALELAGCY